MAFWVSESMKVSRLRLCVVFWYIFAVRLSQTTMITLGLLSDAHKSRGLSFALLNPWWTLAPFLNTPQTDCFSFLCTAVCIKFQQALRASTFKNDDCEKYTAGGSTVPRPSHPAWVRSTRAIPATTAVCLLPVPAPLPTAHTGSQSCQPAPQISKPASPGVLQR